jgi:hypothetical protein
MTEIRVESYLDKAILVVTVLVATLIATISKNSHMCKLAKMSSYYKFLVKTPYVMRLFKGSKYYVEDENYPIVPLKGVKKGLKKVDNMYLPVLIKNISLVRTMNVRPTDCFVTGYPRSGFSNYFLIDRRYFFFIWYFFSRYHMG